jgi:hypothetical protein
MSQVTGAEFRTSRDWQHVVTFRPGKYYRIIENKEDRKSWIVGALRIREQESVIRELFLYLDFLNERIRTFKNRLPTEFIQDISVYKRDETFSLQRIRMLYMTLQDLEHEEVVGK